MTDRQDAQRPRERPRSDKFVVTDPAAITIVKAADIAAWKREQADRDPLSSR